MSMQGILSRVLRADKRCKKTVVMGRAKRGLFHGRHIGFGNTVSHSEQRSRRTWKPNVQIKRYRSDLLEETVKLKVTTKAIKCIDKKGGLDNYLLFTRGKDLGEGVAMSLRLRVKNAKKEKVQALKAEAETVIKTDL